MSAEEMNKVINYFLEKISQDMFPGQCLVGNTTITRHQRIRDWNCHIHLNRCVANKI